MQKQKIKDIAKYFNYNKTDKKNNEIVLLFFFLSNISYCLIHLCEALHRAQYLKFLSIFQSYIF